MNILPLISHLEKRESHRTFTSVLLISSFSAIIMWMNLIVYPPGVYGDNGRNAGAELIEAFMENTAQSRYRGVIMNCTILSDELLDAWEAYEGYSDIGDRIQAMRVLMDEERYRVFFISIRPEYTYTLDISPVIQSSSLLITGHEAGAITAQYASPVLNNLISGPKAPEDSAPVIFGILVFQTESPSSSIQTLSIEGAIQKYQRDWREVENETTHRFRFGFMGGGVPPENRPLKVPGTIPEIVSYLESALIGWP